MKPVKRFIIPLMLASLLSGCVVVPADNGYGYGGRGYYGYEHEHEHHWEGHREGPRDWDRR